MQNTGHIVKLKQGPDGAFYALTWTGVNAFGELDSRSGLSPEAQY